MKKLFILSVFLLFAQPINSQWIIETFDSSAGIFFKEPIPIGFHYLSFYNDTSHYEGIGSLRVEYSVEAEDPWGGGIASATYSLSDTSLSYYNLTGGNVLSFWYKVLQPVNLSSPGDFYLEFKLAEIDEYGLRDVWYHHTTLDFSDISEQWIQVNMPLIMASSGNNRDGFVLQFGDQTAHHLDLEYIRGFEIDLFYSTTGGVPAPMAYGSLLLDRLEVLYPSSVTNEETNLPNKFVMEQNYPNPFNPSTNIQFAINNRQFVQLKIFDLLGHEIATLIDENRDAGDYTVSFDASKLASGMYLYKLQAGGFVETKKMLLMK